MNGYKIVLLKAIFMLYKLPECERVCSGICRKVDILQKAPPIGLQDVRDVLSDVCASAQNHQDVP